MSQLPAAEAEESMAQAVRSETADQAPIGFREFVSMIAALMSLGALGVDSMLPALPAIADRLGVTALVDRPMIITAFVVGLGIGQLIHGPLTDRYGRRPVLIGGLIVYAVCNVLAAAAGSFTLLLVVRFCSGLGVAAGRVVTIALIRDCYSGRAMARVSSLAFMVFMAAPIIAPAFGQAVLIFGSWRLIFGVIALLALLVMAWFAVRMPETLRVENRVPLSFARLRSGWWQTLSDRQSIGYTLAAGFLQGAIFGYIGSIQPIMERVFHRPLWLGAVFAASAGTMAIANLLNSRIVMRLGMRRISQTALVGVVVSASLGVAISRLGVESLILFVVAQAICMACFAIAASNMSAMAMENMGRIAGVASSVQGFIGVTLGAVLGALIGVLFDDSTAPMHAGFLIAGLLGCAITAIVERGRLFQPV